ncbi:MAG: peptidyl-prolyl cis-trans isomerase [Pseudomonadota bacterium]|nr:peptidyl-prolyl cis-trans isomerase [Pseudomonadota bacterium]
MSVLSALRREPLFHFVVIAAGLFLANYLIDADQRETIRVARATVEYLAEQQSDLMQRTLTPAERRQLIEDYVDEEVLLREAYQRGLEKNVRIRRQLVTKMRFLLSEELADPTEAELHAWFDANPRRFEQPAGLSLDHVFFETADAVPDDLLPRLRVGGGWHAEGAFNPALGYVIRDVTERDLVRMLGADAAHQVFALKDGRWSGPIASSRGVHLVRVNARTPARQRRLEEVAAYLKDEWLLEQQQRRIADKIAQLRANYRIIHDDAADR